MSARTAGTHVVIEWSPRGILVHEPGGRTNSFSSANDAATALGSRPVVVAVSRRSMFVRTLRVPNASMADVNTIVRMRLGELFPLPAEELAFNTELTDDLNEDGRLAVVVAMPAVELRRLHQDLQSAGIKIESVVPLAYGSVALAKSLNLNSAAIVSRDESSLGIDLVQDGVLRYSRVASESGSAHAEVGRTFSVAGIPTSEIVTAEGVKVAEASVVSAIAPLEALSGAWPSKVPTLELPEMVAKRLAKAQSSRMRLSGMILIAGLLMCAVAYDQYSKQLQIVKDVEGRQSRAMAKLNREKDALSKDSAAAADIEAVLRRGFEPAQRLSDIALIIANRVPAGAWLTGISLSRGKEATIRGTAETMTSVTDFQNRLTAADGLVTSTKVPERQPLFRGVRLIQGDSGNLNDHPIVQYSITAFPNGNLPLIDPGAKKSTSGKSSSSTASTGGTK